MAEMSVLLVEDEDTIAMALEYMLSRKGLSVSRLMDGTAVMETLAKIKPSAVILDIALPGRNGYQVCQDIRRTPELDGLKIIMITARGGTIERQKCLAIGADDFFSKPFSVADVTDRVANLVAGGADG